MSFDFGIWVLLSKTSGCFIPLSRSWWEQITLFSSAGNVGITTEATVYAAYTHRKRQSLLPKPMPFVVRDPVYWPHVPDTASHKHVFFSPSHTRPRSHSKSHTSVAAVIAVPMGNTNKLSFLFCFTLNGIAAVRTKETPTFKEVWKLTPAYCP